MQVLSVRSTFYPIGLKTTLHPLSGEENMEHPTHGVKGPRTAHEMYPTDAGQLGSSSLATLLHVF
jgi:hypothetical protein